MKIIQKLRNYLISPQGGPIAGLIVAIPALGASFFGLNYAIDNFFHDKVVIRIFLFWFGFMSIGFIPGNILMTLIDPKYNGHKITLIALIIGIVLSLVGWKL